MAEHPAQIHIWRLPAGARVPGLLFPEKTVCKAYINAHGLVSAFTANIRTTSKCIDVPQFSSPDIPKRRCSASTGLPPTRLPPQIKGYSKSNLFRCIFFRISFCNTLMTLPCAQCRFSDRKTQQWSAGKKKTCKPPHWDQQVQDIVWQRDFVLGILWKIKKKKKKE